MPVYTYVYTHVHNHVYMHAYEFVIACAHTHVPYGMSIRMGLQPLSPIGNPTVL